MAAEKNQTPHLSTRTTGVLHVRLFFYSVFAAIYVATEVALGWFVIKWTHAPSVALFAILSVLFFGGSYGLARQLVALLMRYRPLRSLDHSPRDRRVALLYATMNDVVPECLHSISQDYPCDVFVLDDSTSQEARNTVDSISAEKHFTVIRRDKRRGFKAGAINDWLISHGAGYDYIVLLDADSYLPSDWVGETLKYAEHPDNSDVAIFQGLINIWNLDTRFVQTLASMSRIGQFVWEQQLANALDAVFCYGHNVMLRVDALNHIGGFVEGYVSEDFATAVALADIGWHSRFVPLHTYEAMPENVRGFIRRQNKWTRGSMEFFGFSMRSKISSGRKLHLMQIPVGHITNLLLPIGMILTVYGFASTPAGAAAFLYSLLLNPPGVIWSVPILRFMIVFGVLAFIPTLAVRAKCGIKWEAVIRHRWLSSAISTLSMPYEFKSMISYFITGLKTIPVTPKNEKPLSVHEVLGLSVYSFMLEGILISGILLFNPLASVFNSPWLIPMVISPLIIMRFGGKSSYFSVANNEMLEKVGASCLFPNPIGVNALLKNALSRHGQATLSE